MPQSPHKVLLYPYAVNLSLLFHQSLTYFFIILVSLCYSTISCELKYMEFFYLCLASFVQYNLKFSHVLVCYGLFFFIAELFSIVCLYIHLLIDILMVLGLATRNKSSLSVFYKSVH